MGQEEVSSLGYHEKTDSTILWLLAYSELQPAVAGEED
jgi:hypothetical protein